MSREIKPSTCTNFPMFSKVKIGNTGHSYTTYRDMFTYMGLTKLNFNPFVYGEIGVVVGKAMHESEGYGEVLAVRVAAGVGLIAAKGVNKYEAPKPAEPSYQELVTELVTLKAQLWEAEQKLKKVVEVAS